MVVSVGLLTSASISKVIEFEAEQGTSNGDLRTRLDGKKNVYLMMNQYITNNFMVNSSCLVNVSNVVHPSDGSDNRGDIRLDLDTVGSFTTQSPIADVAPSEQWNELCNSGRVGDNKQLQQGIHLASYPGSLGEGVKRSWYLLFAHALNYLTFQSFLISPGTSVLC